MLDSGSTRRRRINFSCSLFENKRMMGLCEQDPGSAPLPGRNGGQPVWNFYQKHPSDLAVYLGEISAHRKIFNTGALR